MADVDEHQKIASLSGSPLKNRSSNEEEGSALKVRFLKAFRFEIYRFKGLDI